MKLCVGLACLLLTAHSLGQAADQTIGEWLQANPQTFSQEPDHHGLGWWPDRIGKTLVTTSTDGSLRIWVPEVAHVNEGRPQTTTAPIVRGAAFIQWRDGDRIRVLPANRAMGLDHIIDQIVRLPSKSSVRYLVAGLTAYKKTFPEHLPRRFLQVIEYRNGKWVLDKTAFVLSPGKPGQPRLILAGAQTFDKKFRFHAFANWRWHVTGSDVQLACIRAKVAHSLSQGRCADYLVARQDNGRFHFVPGPLPEGIHLAADPGRVRRQRRTPPDQ